MNQPAYYVGAAVVGAIAAVLIAHLLEHHSQREEFMIVTEKLNALQNAVGTVTDLVRGQKQEIADLRTQLTALQNELANSQSDAAVLQGQIDALNALTQPPAAQ